MAIVYIVTNIVNGKKYLGKHNGKDPEYLGSGKVIKSAIKKYGKTNFIRNTILECTDERTAYEAEERLSKEWDVVASSDWYNLRCGGLGSKSGPDHPDFGKKHSQKRILENSLAQKNSTRAQNHVKKMIAMHVGETKSIEYKKQMSVSCKNSEAVQSHINYLNKEKLTSESRSLSVLKSLAVHPELLERLRGISGNRKGFSQTPNHIERRIAKLRGRTQHKFSCPHCSAIGGGSVMKRWHFDNCRKKI